MAWPDVLNPAAVLLSALAFADAVAGTVPLRHPGRYAALWGALAVSLQLAGQPLPPGGRAAVWLLLAAAALLLPQGFTTVSRRTTLLCTAEQLAALLLAEGLSLLAWHGQTGLPWETLKGVLRVPVRLSALALFLILSMAARFFALRVHGSLPAAEMCPSFALLPLSQGVLLLISLYIAQEGTSGVPGWPVLPALLCTAAAGVTAFSAGRYVRDTALLRERLRLAEEHLETQTRYYREMQGVISAVNQLRHDMNNQLQTAYTLMERGQGEEARRQLDFLQDGLRERAGARYCANPVADAVLFQKAPLCRREGIRLTVTASLPFQLSLPGAQLCSLISNLMDNAIAGCRGCRPAWIEFDARLRAGCLVLRCRNTAGKPAPKAETQAVDGLPEHGLGLGILRQIAETYGGEVQTGLDDGVFTAVVMLPLP